MSVSHRYIWNCDICPNVGFWDADQIIADGYEVPRPEVPNGWTKVNGLAFCPRHTVFVVVDGVDTFVPVGTGMEKVE